MYLAKYSRQKIVKRKKNHCIVVLECNFFQAIKTILFYKIEHQHNIEMLFWHLIDSIKIKSKQIIKHNFQLI